jgi:hypothetical protein
MNLNSTRVRTVIASYPDSSMHRREFLAIATAAPAAFAQQSAHPSAAIVFRSAEPLEEWKSFLGDPASAHTPAFDDSAWQTVRVPHNWEDYQGYQRKTHGNLHGTAWYRRSFQADPALRARRVFVEFEGVGSYATVWLNSHLLGQHNGGRTCFTFDLTDHLLFDRANILAVRAHHPAMIDDLPYVCGGCWGSPNTEGSQPIGIFRPVHLLVTNPVRIAPFGVHVWTPELSAARAVVRVAVEVTNHGPTAESVRAASAILAADGEVLATIESPATTLQPGASHVFEAASAPIERPHLWSPDDPYLHRVRTTILAHREPVDRTDTPFGMRWIEWPAVNDDTAGSDEGVIDPARLTEAPSSANRFFSRDTGRPIDSQLRIQPVKIYIPSCSAEAATVLVKTPVKNTGDAPAHVKLTSHIRNFAGTKFIYSMDSEQVIAPGATYTFEQTSPEIRFPELWTPARPYLHMVESVVSGPAVLDTAETSFGIATGAGLANKGNAYVPKTSGGAPQHGTQFLLNGKPFFINGIAEYEHLLGGDHAFAPEQIAARMRQIKAAGFNALREAHHPHNLLYNRLCDEMGLLCWPQVTAHIYFDNDRFRDNYRQAVREWVRERRNSPAIVLWGLQNESSLPTAFARELSQIIRGLDPTASSQRKIVTCNGGTGTDCNVPQNWLGTYGGDVKDYGIAVIGQRLVGEYGQWRTAELHAEGEWPATRGGAPGSRVVPEEYFTYCLETRVRQAEERRGEFCGHFMWLLSSHANPGRSEEDCRDGLGLNAVGVVNYKGLLTSWGQPLDAYYMYRANYAPPDREPMVYICSHSWPGRFDGAGVRNNIAVFSNCDEVELFNDNRAASLGVRKRGPKGTHFTWNEVDIRFDTLYAEARIAGRTVASDIIHLDHLAAAPHQAQWLAAQPDNTAAHSGATYLHRVNCGGPDYTDVHGNLWSADRDYLPGKWGSASFAANLDAKLDPRYASQSRIADPIAGTRDPELHRTFRYGREKLAYRFPLPNGNYEVELYFIEPWYGAGGGLNCAGWRLFDVACNGRTVLRDLDIWKEAGRTRALKKIVPVSLSTGDLTISFPRVQSYQAVISAIAISTRRG